MRKNNMDSPTRIDIMQGDKIVASVIKTSTGTETIWYDESARKEYIRLAHKYEKLKDK